MESTKIIITSLKEKSDLIVERFKLERLDNLEIFTGKRENGDNIEQIVLIFTDLNKNNSSKIINFINDNYIFEKIIYIGNAFTINDIDIKVGDVFIPNTFIKSDEDQPIFIDYAIGNSFDLNKFGLILNGICLTSENLKENLEKNKDFVADLYDNEVYDLLSLINDKKMLDKTVVIKEILDNSNDNNNIGNSIDILELIL